MYHLRLKGGHYEMGVKRGKIFNRGKISFPLQMDDFQLEHGKQSEVILRKFFPEVCEEVRLSLITHLKYAKATVEFIPLFGIGS